MSVPHVGQNSPTTIVAKTNEVFPLEVDRLFLAYLDTATLIKVSLVCRSWKILSDEFVPKVEVALFKTLVKTIIEQIKIPKNDVLVNILEQVKRSEKEILIRTLKILYDETNVIDVNEKTKIKDYLYIKRIRLTDLISHLDAQEIANLSFPSSLPRLFLAERLKIVSITKILINDFISLDNQGIRNLAGYLENLRSLEAEEIFQKIILLDSEKVKIFLLTSLQKAVEKQRYSYLPYLIEAYLAKENLEKLKALFEESKVKNPMANSYLFLLILKIEQKTKVTEEFDRGFELISKKYANIHFEFSVSIALLIKNTEKRALTLIFLAQKAIYNENFERAFPLCEHTPELLRKLCLKMVPKHPWWALAVANSMPVSKEQGLIYNCIIDAIIVEIENIKDVNIVTRNVKNASHIALRITDLNLRSQKLKDCAVAILPCGLTMAVDIAKTIPREEDRNKALVYIIETSFKKNFNEIEKILKILPLISDPNLKHSLLSDLSNKLATKSPEMVLQIAGKIEDATIQSELLASASIRLAEKDLVWALETAIKIKDLFKKKEILATLAKKMIEVFSEEKIRELTEFDDPVWKSVIAEACKQSKS